MYFFFSDPSAGGHWSTDGCVVHKTNATHTVCHCNHLTDFAVLFRVSKTKKVNTQIRGYNSNSSALFLFVSMKNVKRSQRKITNFEGFFK